MNYFEHHIGDYAQATSHLTFIEDAAYHRLLRKMYADEKPLPVDVKAVQRLVAARTREERQAVADVLQEFFELREDGWHQARADREIAAFHDGEPERVVKKTNEANRLKAHREERAQLFERLTQAGLHAPWNIAIGELRAMVATLPETQPATPAETAPETKPATAPATPATATQAPSTIPTPHTQSLPQAAAGVDPPLPPPLSKSVQERALDLVVLLRSKGCRIATGNPYALDWAKNGVTDAQVLTAFDRAEEQRQRKADSTPINAGLVNAIVGDIVAKTPPIDFEALARI